MTPSITSCTPKPGIPILVSDLGHYFHKDPFWVDLDGVAEGTYEIPS